MALGVTDTRAETIVDAIMRAHAANPRLNAERARQRSDQQKLPQARAGFLPTINGTADHGRDRLKDMYSGQVASGTPSGVGATLSQPLFDGFRALNEVRRAGAEIRAGREMLHSVSTEILLAAAQTYVDVVRDRAVETLRREAVSIFRTQLSQAEGRHKGGDMTRTGVDQARARLGEAEADHAQSRVDLARSEAKYRAVVGQHPGLLRAPRLAPKALPSSLQAALQMAESENAELRAAHFKYFAARHGVSVAKGAFSPTVSLEANLQRSYGLKVDGTEPYETSMRVRMTVPIFNGGRDLSRVTQAAEIRTQRQLDIEDVRATMRKAVEASWEAVHGARLRLTASRRRLAGAHDALKGLQIEFNGGQVPLIQVLDGRREAIAARVACVDAERDQIFEAFALLAAVGRLVLDRPTRLASLFGPELPDASALFEFGPPKVAAAVTALPKAGAPPQAAVSHPFGEHWRGIIREN